MRFLTQRWAQVLLLLLLLAGALVLRVQEPSSIKRLRNVTFDTYNRILPRAPGEGVVVVDIDEESLKNYGQWPWPRTQLAELVTRLTEMGAKVIAFDMVFAEQDRTSPPLVARTLRNDPEMQDVAEKLAALPENEIVFAEAIKKSGIVVTGFAAADQQVNSLPVRKALGLVGIPLDLVMRFGSFATTLPILSKAARGNGSFTAAPEEDGVIRNVSLLIGYRGDGNKGEIYPSLSLEALRIYLGTQAYKVGVWRNKGFSGIMDISMIGKDGRTVTIPTDSAGRIPVYYAGHRKNLYIPVWRVLTGHINPDRIRDKIVFVGTSSIGLKDLRSSPLDAVVPGVEIHVEIVEQALQGKYLHSPAFLNDLELVATGIIGLVIIFASPFMSVMMLALLVSVTIGGGAMGAFYAYQVHGYLLDPVYPGLTILLVFIVSSVFNSLRTEMEKKAVRQAFSHYISPVLMEELAADPEKLKLGGEVREVSVMFTDIRNFTTISESMDPAELIKMMNDFLTPMTSCVLESRGTVDKYMGDAMMAFWNAPLDDPDHARHACAAALQMVQGLKPVNENLKASAEKQGRVFHELRAGIGINTGRASVGNMGSKQRFAYSALGDTVNLASRLESQTKGYGITIMISAATRAQAPEFAAVEIDLLTVKGRTEPERVYTLLGTPEEAETPEFTAFAARHAEMLEAYRAQRWDSALQLAEECKTLRPDLSGLYKLYAERVAHWRQNPPPADWAGVWVAKEK